MYSVSSVVVKTTSTETKTLLRLDQDQDQDTSILSLVTISEILSLGFLLVFHQNEKSPSPFSVLVLA